MFRGKTGSSRLAVIAASIAATGVLAFGGSASAATTVGNGCTLDATIPIITVVSTANATGDPFPATIPSAGVITSWTLDAPPPVELELIPKFFDALKVFRPAAVPGWLQVVGESSLSQIGPGSNTHPTRIPVQAGDLLGNVGREEAGGESKQFAALCQTSNGGDTITGVEGNPPVGATVSMGEGDLPSLSQPITVAVEPDADGDGFGDETQDQCPTDASTQGPCPAKAPPVAPAPVAPAPPAPPVLSASAVAKRGLVTVTLTASAQASVTVGGTAKLGKRKRAKLGGGTQVVVPGAPARFVLLFPAKLKARLKHLTPKHKLSLRLSATAPGSTGTRLTVKVKGQKKPSR
jgi:hypothetical protein